LYALQHRGQESAGMAVGDGHGVLVFKEMGLVSQVFDEATLATLQGYVAIGHVRYSTTGGSRWENAQPVFKTNAAGGGFAVAHNGNLTTTAALAAELIPPECASSSSGAEEDRKEGTTT
jgi:amidophosphoribosyltransferase